MKQLPLNNNSYLLMEEGFRQWLENLGYSKSSIYNLPNLIRELFYYLECAEIQKIEELNKEHLNAFFDQLKTRKNHRREGGLSNNYIQKYEQAYKCFSKYLQLTRNQSLPEFKPSRIQSITKLKYFSREEINSLYEVTDDSLIGIRNRALLAVFYGCGLRRNEGYQLDYLDIKSSQRLIHVKKSKGNKQRYVPMATKCFADVEEYLITARPKLLKEKKQQAFFVTSQGNRLSYSMLHLSFKGLAKEAGINKGLGLHALRHSIATHLLANGLSLEKIAQFLGHSSLESTQIYTHILSHEEL